MIYGKMNLKGRLKEVDRAFISTLYSLTDTTVKFSILENCFNERLLKMKHVDYTINNCEAILARLNQSIISLVDKKGVLHIGVINPSVNDYMKIVFKDNILELNEVRNSIRHICQFDRCYANEELPDIFYKLTESRKILNIDFSFQEDRIYLIVSNICLYKIEQQQYKMIIESYLNQVYGYQCQLTSELLSHAKILEILLNTSLCSYYSLLPIIIDKIFC